MSYIIIFAISFVAIYLSITALGVVPVAAFSVGWLLSIAITGIAYLAKNEPR